MFLLLINFANQLLPYDKNIKQNGKTMKILYKNTTKQLNRISYNNIDKFNFKTKVRMDQMFYKVKYINNIVI